MRSKKADSVFRNSLGMDRGSAALSISSRSEHSRNGFHAAPPIPNGAEDAKAIVFFRIIMIPPTAAACGVA